MILLNFGMISCGGDDHDGPQEPEPFVVEEFSPAAVSGSNPIKIYVHFMPWFETKETSDNGNWGIHWTMAGKNPDVTDAGGKREIASYYYPLTGPYASSDPDIIEYQLLLMKYSGVDGVLIDWYGSSDLNDYGSNRRNTEALIGALDKVGLKFAIVYEDHTISELMANDASFERITGARNDMIYLKQKYFSKSSYITVDGKPLLLVFGPQEFHQPSEWAQIFSVFSTKPCFMVLNGKSGEAGDNSSGEYIWVDQSSLDSKYDTKDQFDVFIGGAYPGFKDYYGDGGWGESFSWQIDHNNGETFRQNLQKAKDANVDRVQLITWNDYGEGTMIEPTLEFGFTFLHFLQSFAGVDYDQTELEEIYDLYQLRKEYQGDADTQDMLDQAFYYFVSLQTGQAKALLGQVKDQ
jgi:hypothetical protein